MLAGKAIMYATDPILSKISNGPQNRGANFAQFPSLSEILLGLTWR